MEGAIQTRQVEDRDTNSGESLPSMLKALGSRLSIKKKGRERGIDRGREGEKVEGRGGRKRSRRERKKTCYWMNEWAGEQKVKQIETESRNDRAVNPDIQFSVCL